MNLKYYPILSENPKRLVSIDPCFILIDTFITTLKQKDEIRAVKQLELNKQQRNLQMAETEYQHLKFEKNIMFILYILIIVAAVGYKLYAYSDQIY